MSEEIEFTKYKQRGNYHWQGMKKSIFAFNAFLSARYRMVLNQLPKIGLDKKVIDIGCGDGVLDYLIRKEKGGRVYGIDPSCQAIEIAKKKIKKLNIKYCSFRVGNGYKLPFKSNFFDYAILADVIEHVGRPERILMEASRVLKPGGMLILSSIIKSTQKPADKMHFKEYTVDEMENFLKKFFDRVKIIKSHPLFLKKIYQWHFKMGKYQPQLFRYFLNIFPILFSLNPFEVKIGRKFSCQTAVCFKSSSPSRWRP